MTGAGTSIDPRTHNFYAPRWRMTAQQIDAAYRGGWVMRKIIDKPATEMVREWRDWQADADVIEKLEDAEEALDLRNKVRRAEVLRGLGGAGMVLWIDGDDPTTAVDPTRIKADALKAVHVWHRDRFTLGDQLLDWADPWFGFPSYYEIRLAGTGAGANSLKFHPSRVIAFRGDAIPDIATVSWQDAFWGESKVAVVMDAVQNVDTSQNSFAALIKDARNRRIGIPELTKRVATQEGEGLLGRRIAAMAMGESMFGVTWYDAGSSKDGTGGETIEDRQMVWTGIPDIAAMYLAAAAGAADMPATVLLGKSPDGMNATGDSDRLIWENTIKARQDLDLRPCLTQLDAALVPSALGKADDSVWYEFAPLSTLNEKDEATAFYTTMQAMDLVEKGGAIPDVAYSKGLQNLLTERGWIPGLDAALAEIPEAERLPSLVQPADPNAPDPSALQNGPGDPANQNDPQQQLKRAANDAAKVLAAKVADAIGIDDEATLATLRKAFGGDQ